MDPLESRALLAKRTDRDLRAEWRMMYRSVPPLVALIAIVGAAFFGIAVANELPPGDAAGGQYAMDFGSERAEFCAEDGVIDHMQTSYSGEPEEGHRTPEEAARAFEAAIQQASVPSARIRENAGQEAFDEMFDLLAPSRSFGTTESRAVESDSGTVHYFDKPSDRIGVLEARVVVGEIAGQWVVLEAFRCESTIASDLDRFKELRSQEVSP